MNRTFSTLAAAFLAVGCAAAQDDHVVIAPQIKVMSVQGGVMGKPVKGAPYSGTEVSETTQVLGDGTRIHNGVQTQVYRDSEGRMRRESGNEVTIWDPVANVSWVLNPKTQTARKLPFGVYYFNTSTTGSVTRTMVLSSDGKQPSATVADELKVRNQLEGLREAVRGNLEAGGMIGGLPRGAGKTATESLGKRMIEGVNADGTKSTATIEQGAIGNDRPIQSTTERWFSPELQTVMLTRRNDPRTGEETFRLMNVSRSEPPAYLFQVPTGYQIVEK